VALGTEARDGSQVVVPIANRYRSPTCLPLRHVTRP
jgi:hypothetical protein